MRIKLQWLVKALLAAIFILSGLGKMVGGDEIMAMAQNLGLESNTFMVLGIIEILAATLFLIPRTSIIGLLLMMAYMGGAMATHLGNNEPIIVPLLIESVLWIAGAWLFPELTARLKGK